MCMFHYVEKLSRRILHIVCLYAWTYESVCVCVCDCESIFVYARVHLRVLGIVKKKKMY